MAPIEWYYSHGDKQSGPISAAELRQLVASGALRPDDLVWREGMADWVPAQNVKGLFGAEGKRAPDAAPPPPRVAAPALARVNLAAIL